MVLREKWLSIQRKLSLVQFLIHGNSSVSFSLYTAFGATNYHNKCDQRTKLMTAATATDHIVIDTERYIRQHGIYVKRE